MRHTATTNTASGGRAMSAAVQQAPARNGSRPPPVLRIAGLSKTFGATRALIDASLDIRPGEIHALVGQNGSGKSTLIKALAGYHAPDPGSEAEIDGAPFDLGHSVPDGTPLRPSGPRARARAQRHGQPRAARRLRPRRDGPRALARTGAGDAPGARALRRRSRHPPPAGGGHAGRADGRRDRGGAPGLAGRQRRARPRRADRGAAARRGRAAVRDGPRGAGSGHERAVRLAPPRRDLRAGRSRDGPARRPRDRHARCRGHRRGAAGKPDGRRGGRSRLSRAGRGAPGRARRARGARRPRPLAARRRPRRPPRRDPRHRRPRGRRACSSCRT